MSVTQESPLNRSIFALIVAIDEYKKAGIPPLSGCVNDGLDFQSFLTEILRVHPDNVHTLINDSATRANILGRFDSHLIFNKKIKKDDLIFFYYAGHGDRVDAPDGCTGAQEGKVEAICPVNVSAFENDPAVPRITNSGTVTEPVYGIPDWTFHALMRQLADAKGNNIVAILDCCHSGGAMRGDMDMDTLRELPDADPSTGLSKRLQLPVDLDKDILDRAPESLRGTNFSPTYGFAYSGTTSHVLLAACQPREKAREHRQRLPDGRYQTRGRFTYDLLGYIREKQSGEQRELLTYAQLVKRVAQRMHSDSQNFGPQCSTTGHFPTLQQPHCEGKHMDRLLFKTQEAGVGSTFALTYDRSEDDGNAPFALHVDAGSIQGVIADRTGAQFMVEIGSTTVILYPITVGPLHSVVTIWQPEGASGVAEKDLGGKSAVVSAWNRTPLKVHSSESEDLPVAPSAGRHGAYTFVRTQSALADNTEYADISYGVPVDSDANNGDYALTRHDPLIATFAKSRLLISEALNAAHFEAIAKFNFYLYNHQRAPDIRNDLSIKVELHGLVKQERGGIRARLMREKGAEDLFVPVTIWDTADKSKLCANPHSGYQLCEDDLKIKEATITDTRRSYGLTLINESKEDIFPYVFYFDPGDYSITEWYLPPNPLSEAAPLRPGSLPLEIGYGANDDRSIKFSLPPDASKDSGFLKIYVSTSYVDMSGLIQPSVFEDGDSRAVEVKKVPPMSGWSSSIYVLTTALSAQA